MFTFLSHSLFISPFPMFVLHHSPCHSPITAPNSLFTPNPKIPLQCNLPPDDFCLLSFFMMNVFFPPSGALLVFPLLSTQITFFCFWSTCLCLHLGPKNKFYDVAPPNLRPWFLSKHLII